MRIVSPLLSTTEIMFALGLGDEVAAVTPECDHPPEARQRPVMTSRARAQSNACSMLIDAAMRSRSRRTLSIYRADVAMRGGRYDVLDGHACSSHPDLCHLVHGAGWGLVNGARPFLLS